MDQMTTSRLSTRAVPRIAAVMAILGAITGWVVLGAASTALASTPQYEMYCPGTPVGTIVINDVVTTGTISPATPAAGSTFEVTNYQTQLDIPSQIATAAAALGNTAITGSATATLDATGATPASLNSPTLGINTPIPSPIPSTGLSLDVPSPATTVGPFTASGGAITISQASQASLGLVVSGNTINLKCTSYTNDDIPTSGITSSTPSGSPISPQLATATASGTSSTGATTTTTPSTTATTAAPSTAATSGLAYTGTGPGLYLLAELGMGVLVLAGLITIGYRGRHALASLYRTTLHRDSGG